jgi:hypothetical protein
MPTETTASLLIGTLDTQWGARVLASSELVDGLVTVLPGSSIGEEELALAASHGLRVAVAADSLTDGDR